MRLVALLPLFLSLALLSPVAAQIHQESEGSADSAVLGGLLGAYSGMIVGGLSGRHIFCPQAVVRGSPCPTPILVGSGVGLAAGIYAGVESDHRVKGAYVGAGLGALAGLVTFAAFFRSELDKSEGQHLEPLWTALFVGAAFGAIAGGVIAGDGDSNTTAPQLPLGIRLRF
jgi:hypothetical protein